MKIFKVGDFLKFLTPEKGKIFRLTILGYGEGAKEVGGIFVVVPPKTSAVKYHYHRKRESILFIIEGKAKLTVEKKEYFVEANELIYIPPLEKHMLENVGETDLRYLEFFTYPPVLADFIEVK